MIHSLRATVRLIGGQNRPTLRLQGGWKMVDPVVRSRAKRERNDSRQLVDTREETLEHDIIIRAEKNQLHAIWY